MYSDIHTRKWLIHIDTNKMMTYEIIDDENDKNKSKIRYVMSPTESWLV